MAEYSSRETFQAVLPLALAGSRDGNDLARAVVQGRSLRRFFRRDQHLCINVVGRAAELAQITDALKPLETPWLEYRVFDETIVHPEMTRAKTRGWHKQQIIKMAAPEWLNAAVWLTLDADVLCTKPVGIDDLMPEGRALLTLDNVRETPIYTNWSWETRELLGMIAPPLTVSGSITPLLYTARIMRAVHQLLEVVHGRPWKDVLLTATNAPELYSWAENQLYYAVAVQTGLLRQHHAISGIDTGQSLICSGVWYNEEWENWDPLPAFDRTRPGFFAVCSSYTGMPAEVVAEKVAPFLVEPPDGTPAPPVKVGFVLAGQRHEDIKATRDLRVRILSRDPLVLYGPYDTGMTNLVSKDAMAPFAETPALILLSLASSRESPEDGRAIADRIARRRRERPLHRVIVLCNTEAELDLLRELGVDCVLASDNIFIDERPFLIQENRRPEFDAVYNATYHQAKRHALAAEIKSLALIYADWHNPHPDYRAASQAALTHATYLNHCGPNGEYRYFNRAELAEQIVRARVGLCLSEAEGAMRASIEYLFAGLPIVSTLHKGGRDQFFDSEFCVVVPPSPKLIAEAVQELIKLDIPAGQVRLRTMHKLARHRERLVQVVHQALAMMGCQRPPKLDWPWLVEGTDYYSLADFHKVVRRF